MLLGTDIEQISRIQRVISRTPRFAEKVFTPAERSYCESQGRPAQHYTARFCAKEAFAKALGTGFYWQDVEVVNDENGAPGIRTRGSAAEALAGRAIRLSLSHAGDYAVATVIIEDL
jgi:holo-[acyl-carrier protein] synthase